MTGPSRAHEDFDDASVDALERLVRRVAALNERAVCLRADRPALDALSDEVAALEAKFAPFATGKPLPRYRYREFSGHSVHEMLPYSPASGRFHPSAPRLDIERDGDRIVGRGTFTVAFEGPPDCVHGGVISLVYDQLLAMANLVRGLGGYTASLTVEYKKKTPLHVPTVWTCWTDSVDGRKVRARGTCHADGELVTEAHGLFVRAV